MVTIPEIKLNATFCKFTPPCWRLPRMLKGPKKKLEVVKVRDIAAIRDSGC